MALEKGLEVTENVAGPSVIGELVIARSLMDARIDEAKDAGDDGLVHDLEIATVHADKRIAKEIDGHLQLNGFNQEA